MDFYCIHLELALQARSSPTAQFSPSVKIPGQKPIERTGHLYQSPTVTNQIHNGFLAEKYVNQILHTKI
jgi:hypothetical protein